MRGIVAIAMLSEQNLLAALSNHAQGWFNHTVQGLERRRGARQIQSRKRLGCSIFVHSLRNAFKKFFTVRLYPQGFTFCLLEDRHRHRNLFSGFPPARLEGVQNYSIIGDYYSTTLGAGASTISGRQRIPLLLAFEVDWMGRVSDKRYQS